MQKTRAFDAAETQSNTEGMRKKNWKKRETERNGNEGGTAHKGEDLGEKIKRVRTRTSFKVFCWHNYNNSNNNMIITSFNL